ncbi:MAG: rhodanese-like domain-containing protein [Planctomycetota bacterium]|nr:MAG: rhodanese-like domain-containing protein [Planctomycetota bacterium]
MRTILEMILLTVLALGIGLSTNALRTKGSIKVRRAYFRTAVSHPEASRAKETRDHSSSATTAQHSTSTQTSTAQRPSPASTDPTNDDVEAHAEHGFQNITTEEVAALLADPNTALGLNLILDARDDEAYEEGHIPGAIQVYYYEIERYLDEILLEQIAGAEKVIVYCNGGSCEDSAYLCRVLIDEYDVPYEKLYLYGGGWKAWTAKGQPVATGREGQE